MSKQDDVEMHSRCSTAAEWLAILQDADLTHEQFLAWERWMEADPGNCRSFDEMVRTSRRVAESRRQLRDLPMPTGAETAADAYAGNLPVGKWLEQEGAAGRTTAPAASRRAMRWSPGVLAASIAALALPLVLIFFSLPDQGLQQTLHSYQTAKREHRRVSLSDGSVIELAAKSALSVSYSADRRTVVLEDGEALFTVAPDPDRPFVVIAGSGRVTAVGTAFNVRRSAGRVVVTVTDGTVEVQQQDEPSRGTATVDDLPSGKPPSATVTVGEQVVYSPGGIVSVADADTELALSWQSGRLQFRAERLEYVIESVNRYSPREVIIADERVENLVFTGSVFQDQTDDWLQGLEEVFPVDVIDMGGSKLLVRSRPEAAPE